jgi:predicted GIY-YIG superfamily endonuclease
MQFNILDYVSDDIGNIDLTKSYVYVLKLEDDRYYVGRTSNFMQRMNEHFRSGGSEYTKKYKPIKIVEVFEEKDKYDERDKT